MSYDENGYPVDEDIGEGIDIAKKARQIQQAFATVPQQAELVSKETKRQANRIRREMQRVTPPRMPQKPAKVNPVSFDKFAGRRRRRQDIYQMFSQGT